MDFAGHIYTLLCVRSVVLTTLQGGSKTAQSVCSSSIGRQRSAHTP